MWVSSSSLKIILDANSMFLPGDKLLLLSSVLSTATSTTGCPNPPQSLSILPPLQIPIPGGELIGPTVFGYCSSDSVNILAKGE